MLDERNGARKCDRRMQAAITYIGHATLLIEMSGLRILTDPVLRHHVGGLIRRQTPVPTQHFRQVDLVLISHLHWDHLDLPSLRLLGKHTHLVAPNGSAHYLRSYGFSQVTEMVENQTITVGDVQITATYAHHQGASSLFRPATTCLGYVVQGQQRLYFAGDTDLFPEMSLLAPDLDLALLPVWGWGPTLGVGHMDPRRAAEALTLLQPRLAMPIHWGTLFPLGMRHFRPKLLSAPPRLFAKHAQELAPDVQVHIVEPGHILQT